MSWYNSGSWIKVHSYRAHSKCPLVGYQCLIEKKQLSFLPCRGTSVYPVNKQQPPTGRTKLILDVSAFNFFFPFIVSFLSFQLNVSFPCIASFILLPFVSPLPFHALLLPFRSMSYIPFVTSSHSFQLFVSVHCVFPFVSPFPYYALLPSARFKSYIPFVSSSLSFQLFPAVCSVLPSDLILPVSSQLFLSVRCVLSFISSLLFHLLLPFFRINSYVLFVSFFLPFKLFLSIRCVCAFVFLSFQFSSSICYFLSFA